MYKVKYYTLGMIKRENNEYETGNIKQYNNIFYTNVTIDNIENELQKAIDKIKGENKYKPVITNIEAIEGHL